MTFRRYKRLIAMNSKVSGAQSKFPPIMIIVGSENVRNFLTTDGALFRNIEGGNLFRRYTTKFQAPPHR